MKENKSRRELIMETLEKLLLISVFVLGVVFIFNGNMDRGLLLIVGAGVIKARIRLDRIEEKDRTIESDTGESMSPKYKINKGFHFTNTTTNVQPPASGSSVIKDTLLTNTPVSLEGNEKLQTENTNLKSILAEMCEGLDCLPSCDSWAHDDLCPLCSPGYAIKKLQAENSELRAMLRRAKCCAECGSCPICCGPTCNEEEQHQPNCELTGI